MQCTRSPKIRGEICAKLPIKTKCGASPKEDAPPNSSGALRLKSDT